MTNSDRAVTAVQLLNDAGRHDEALRQLAPILARAPEDHVVLGELARAQLGRGDLELALQAAQALIRQHPEYFYGEYLRSLVLRGMGDYPGAVRAAEEAIRLAPQISACHRALAWAADQLPGGRTLAWQAASHAVTLDPQDPETHVCFGTVVMDQNPTIASQAFQEALRLDPSHALARHNLAVLHLRQSKMADAAEGLLSAASLDPRQTHLEWNFGRVVRHWLVWTHWGGCALYLGVRATIEDRDYDRPGIVWLAPVALVVATCVGIWWTRRTVLRLGAHGRSVMWRTLHRSPLHALRFWCVVLGLAAVVAMGLGFTGPMRLAATNTAIAFLAAGFATVWMEVACQWLTEWLKRWRRDAPSG